MPPLPLTTANFGRPRVGLPNTRLVNGYIETTKGGPTQAARIPRPGLTHQYTIGTGPILRQFELPGFFNGDLFSISAGEFFRNSTDVGSVAYGVNPRMAGANQQLMIEAGGGLWVYDGTNLTAVTQFTAGEGALPSMSGVAVLYNIFIYPVAGSNQWFFSRVGDGTIIDAANFSSAQTSPDPIVEVAVLAEELLFFKPTAVEFWDFTGSLTAPFAESPGRTYSRGCAAQGSVVKLDNAMFWVGDDLAVYRSSAVPLKVSTPYIDDRLKAANNVSPGVQYTLTALTASVEGHVFYVINLPTLDESYAYDCQTQEWAVWGTAQVAQHDAGLFLGNTAAGQASTGIFVGSYKDGQVYSLDETSNADGNLTKQVVVTGAIWMTEGAQRCNNVSLACVRGVGNSQAPNPIVNMRFSDDGGRTFTSWMQGFLGMVGQYDYKAVWRNLGLMRQPGRLFEFTVYDPVLAVIEGASFNVARP